MYHYLVIETDPCGNSGPLVLEGDALFDGTIQSPNRPVEYENTTKCWWRFQIPAEKDIKIEVSGLKIDDR